MPALTTPPLLPAIHNGFSSYISAGSEIHTEGKVFWQVLAVDYARLNKATYCLLCRPTGQTSLGQGHCTS